MSMLYSLRQASDATISYLLSNPQSIWSFLGLSDPATGKRPSLVQSLFRQASKLQEPEQPSYPWNGSQLAECDLDKAWHGLIDDDILSYLTEFYESLKAFVVNAADRQLGMVAHLS